MSSHSNPPIPDSNKNGILDGKDILKKLAQEDKSSNETTAPAHGLLKFLRIDTLAITYAFSNKSSTILAQCTTFLSQAMNNIITALPHTFPTKAEALKDAAYESHKRHLSPQETRAIVSRMGDLYDFSTTFKQTFPKGIKLSPEDTKILLEHFEPTVDGAIIIPEQELSPQSPPKSSPNAPKQKAPSGTSKKPSMII